MAKMPFLTTISIAFLDHVNALRKKILKILGLAEIERD
jgi:hypothetical protein